VEEKATMDAATKSKPTQATRSDKYGKYYWRIDLSNSEVIGCFADEVEVLPDGTLALLRVKDGKVQFQNLIVAAGKWDDCYAASMWDGSAVAIDQWERHHPGW
jgi:hypothetical protein